MANGPGGPMANGPGGPMANMHGGLATFLTVTGPAVFALPKLSTFRVSKPPQMWTGSGWRGIEGCKRSGRPARQARSLPLAATHAGESNGPCRSEGWAY